MKAPWMPESYLKFGDERTRPAIDLATRIRRDAPVSVIDLGCGPGNSTRVLRQRWPKAHVLGLDSSPEMIERARAESPDHEWVVGSIEDWSPQESFDVVFSNAALQWARHHGPLVRRLLSTVAPGGAFAFQIPSADYALVRTLIHQIASEAAWAKRMAGPLAELTLESPEFYYDQLAPIARAVDVWETTYLHVMASHSAIVEWISSTGLRPFLNALESAEERQSFTDRLLRRVGESYQIRANGRVLFPFKRTFVIAYR
jgi:trans-aconitate 2-methyltransferase